MTSNCLYDCLQGAGLHQYYRNFTDVGITSSDALGSLSMHDYPTLGLNTMEDRRRLWDLVQIVKQVQREGKQCCHTPDSKTSPRSPRRTLSMDLSNHDLYQEKSWKSFEPIRLDYSKLAYEDENCENIACTEIDSQFMRHAQSSKKKSKKSHESPLSSETELHGNEQMTSNFSPASDNYIPFIPSNPSSMPVGKIVHNSGYNYGVPKAHGPKTSKSTPEKGKGRIKVCVRKRPLTLKEHGGLEKDIIETEGSNMVVLNEAKLALDLAQYIQQVT